MVWGMALPSGFGEFWPDGDFEKDPKTREDGWFDRLSAYYEEQTPEEQKRLFDYKGDPGNKAHSYRTFPARKLTAEPGSKDRNGLDPVYGTLEPHEVPGSWDIGKTYKTLGSLIHLHSKILAVDARLKAIIERLEPEVHEFFELPICMPKGVIYPERYYILRVGQYFDAVSIEDSWEGSFWYSESNPGVTFPETSKKAISGLAFRKTAFGKAHLWRERYPTFQENLTCFSDELIAEIEKAGLRIPKHYKMKEVGEVTPGTAIMQEAA